MSRSQSASADAHRAQYLHRVLQLNPLDRATDVIRARSEFLGLVVGKSASPLDAGQVESRQAERQRALATLEKIRESFWQSDLDVLQRQLRALRVDEFPDLKHAASRLWITAQHRAKFPRLAEESDFDAGFFKAFREVLVCSPRSSPAIKERVRKSLGKPKRLPKIKRMVRLLRTELPEVCALESSWLDSLRRARAVRERGEESPSLFGNISLDGWGWVIWVVLFVGLRLLAALARN